MILSDYKMISCGLELRFDPAYRWLDQSGSIAESLIECDPDLGLNAMQQHSIHMVEPDTGLGIAFGLTRVHVAQQSEDVHSIDNGALFFDRAHMLAGVALDGLRVANLQRLGFSISRRLGTDTLADAVAEWECSGLARLTAGVFPDKTIGIRNIAYYLDTDAFEHIQDMRLKIKADIFELSLAQNQSDSVQVSIEKIYKQPSEQRKKRILDSRKMKKALEDHPRAGIVVELEWIADFPRKIDTEVLGRWLRHLRVLADETHRGLILKG